MRKVTAGLFHALDGVVEAPNQFQFDSFDADLGGMLGAIMGRVDTVLMGRVGYQEWAGYWPQATADGDFADFINGVPKFVASDTLSGPLEWNNARLIEGDMLDFVRTLKAGPGGEISAMGGISLVRQLLFAGLLDELTLITHPVVAGSGRPLFEKGDPVTRLTLLGSQHTEKGNVVSTYGLRG
ncbi:dihydrofolate reductase family protein [Devosia beringensis]|uniref:dihydrofolate reductase family protein n=1 Tax=Devosia beringensis TaxID=2657486 RepID=UPI00186BABAA|nr:dihydrofolate reductase family protein [Devosia beringensis]